jgi:hypothetical protein
VAKHERWTGPADIAWCDEHGLHGSRRECFECGKSVEQIRMLPIDDLLGDKAVEAVCRRLDGDWYEGKDHTREGEDTWDDALALLRAAVESASPSTEGEER